MKLTRLIPTLLLFLLALSDAAEASDLDADMTEVFADLFRHSLEGPPNTERAAFITMEPDGGLACLLWPPSRGFRSESYNGLLPLGLLAIAHTHPQGADRPSPQDAAEAARIGIPIYVLTRSSITRVDPDQNETRLVRTRWFRPSGEDPRPCRAIDPAAIVRQHIEKSRRMAAGAVSSESAHYSSR